MTAIQRMQIAIMRKMPTTLNIRLAKGDIGVTIKDWIGLVIGLFVGIIMIPIVEEQVRTTNTTAWDFTGSAGAITLFRLMPFIFIAGVLIWFVGKLFGKW